MLKQLTAASGRPLITAFVGIVGVLCFENAYAGWFSNEVEIEHLAELAESQLDELTTTELEAFRAKVRLEAAKQDHARAKGAARVG